MSKAGNIDDLVWREEKPAAAVRASSRWRPVLVAALVFVALLVIYPPVAAIASRRTFGTFAFWAPPQRVDYCGRRYYESGIQATNPAQLTSQSGGRGAVWKRVTWTYSGRSIFAAVLPVKMPQQVCTMILYTPVGNGRWDVYPLSGGP